MTERPTLTPEDVTSAWTTMCAEPSLAYSTLVTLGSRWLALRGLSQRAGCARLSEIIKERYDIDQHWSGIWYHLNNRHRGMDVAAALALFGAIQHDIAGSR